MKDILSDGSGAPLWFSTIRYSRTHRVVVVKANILDAVVDPVFFRRIVHYFEALFNVKGKKHNIFLDINGTINLIDGAAGKNSQQILMEALFNGMRRCC